MSALQCSQAVQPRCSQLQRSSAQRSAQRPFTTAVPRRTIGQPLQQRKFVAGFRLSALGDPEDEQKKLTRETEPEQYWQTKSEAKGENPAKDPLAIIGILGIFFPFILLGIAIATGYVDVSNYRYGGH